MFVDIQILLLSFKLNKKEKCISPPIVHFIMCPLIKLSLIKFITKYIIILKIFMKNLHVYHNNNEKLMINLLNNRVLLPWTRKSSLSDVVR